jgi:kinetochore protein NDC80
MDPSNRRRTMSSSLLGSSITNSRNMNGSGSQGGKPGAMAPPPSVHRPVTSRRMSVAPAGLLQRRSSAYTMVKAPPGVKGDPRPISDKGYQASCARKVLDFLVGHGYEFQVTLKTLSSPTTKDYTNIMMFIIKYLDPSLLKNFAKIEEEIPQLYKRLRYPFTISKSNLTAVGSPHTWPSILAALSWVVELIEYCECAEKFRMEDADERAAMDADFFEYVSESYQCFMSGDDERCDKIDAEKGSQIEEKALEVKKEAEGLLNANESLKEKIEALRLAPQPLKEARKRLEDTQNDKDRFLKLIDNLQNHHSTLVRKVAELRADFSSLQTELRVVEEDNTAYRGRIAAQTVHPADIIRMNQEKSKLQGSLDATRQQRDAAESKAEDTESQLRSKFDEIEDKASEYMSLAHRLQLVPATGKRAEGFNFETRLDRNATTSGSMISLDFKGIVKPTLQRIQDQYNAKARFLVKEELVLTEKMDAVQDRITKRAEENALKGKEVNDLENQYRIIKQELEQEVASAMAQVEGLASEVANIRGACDTGLLESEERLVQASAECDALQQACDLEFANLNRDLTLALDAILNHKIAIETKVRATEERMMACLEAVEDNLTQAHG